MQPPPLPREQTSKSNIWRIVCWIAGIAILGELCWMVVKMVKVLDMMGGSGGADPSELAESISEALITAAGGLVVGIPVLLLFIVAMIMARRKRSSNTPD